MMGSPAQEERAVGVDMARLLAARTALGSGAAGDQKAARLEECICSLEAEKAKMEVFRRELPISVNLIADVIEWMKDEVVAEEQRRPAPEKEMFAPATLAPVAAMVAKRKAEGVKVEADANEKRSWMSSAQLWSCGGSNDSTSNSNGGVKKQAHKVSNAFMAPSTFTGSPNKAAERAAAAAPSPVQAALSLSSPAVTDAAPSATSSAVTDYAGAPRQPSQQRKARRSWSPELHRRFVAALQRLGGPQAATPKQIRDLMKVDGLTNDEVKSHLQKYRLHTRRASDGGDQQVVGLWSPPPDQYTTSQHSTSQSGSPQGPLQLTGSSRAVSLTAGDSCGGEEEEDEDGRSESCSWEIPNGEKASSS